MIIRDRARQDHVTRVPFLIKGPGIAPNQGLAHVGSMADVAPTILELVGGSALGAVLASRAIT